MPVLRLGHRQVQRRGPHRTPGIGDDAVGAEIDAAVLNLQHGPGPLRQTAGGKDLKFPAPQGGIDMLPLLPV